MAASTSAKPVPRGDATQPLWQQPLRRAKAFQSLPKLDRRTRIVDALAVQKPAVPGKLRDRKPSLFNAIEIFDHTGFSVA